ALHSCPPLLRFCWSRAILTLAAGILKSGRAVAAVDTRGRRLDARAQHRAGITRTAGREPAAKLQMPPARELDQRAPDERGQPPANQEMPDPVRALVEI